MQSAFRDFLYWTGLITESFVEETAFESLFRNRLDIDGPRMTDGRTVSTRYRGRKYKVVVVVGWIENLFLDVGDSRSWRYLSLRLWNLFRK